MGFNWQAGCFVFGPEVEAGYMDLKGRGVEPGLPGDTFGSSKSDLFTTFRGRVGFAAGCWLFYGTGGAMGVNYTTRVFDNEDIPRILAPTGSTRTAKPSIGAMSSVAVSSACLICGDTTGR